MSLALYNQLDRLLDKRDFLSVFALGVAVSTALNQI